MIRWATQLAYRYCYCTLTMHTVRHNQRGIVDMQLLKAMDDFCERVTQTQSV